MSWASLETSDYKETVFEHVYIQCVGMRSRIGALPRDIAPLGTKEIFQGVLRMSSV